MDTLNQNIFNTSTGENIFAGLIVAFILMLIGLYGGLIVKQFENKLDKKKQKANQRLKFYLPLLRFSYDLDRRIGHILKELHSDWLNSTHLEKIKNTQGFAINPNEKGYFIISCVYMFACFFGWAEAIKKGVDTIRPFSEKSFISRWLFRIKKNIYSFFSISERKNIFLFDPDISIVSKLFQYEELFNDYVTFKKLTSPRDACKLHKQLQYSIGELMLEKDGHENFRIKSFREFFEYYVQDEKFRYWFIILENLFTDLNGFEKDKHIETQVEMKNDIRPLRLLAIRYWCRVLMKNMSKELDIDTHKPDEVLEGISDKLKETIKSVKIEKLESYLLGIRINNN